MLGCKKKNPISKCAKQWCLKPHTERCVFILKLEFVLKVMLGLEDIC